MLEKRGGIVSFYIIVTDCLVLTASYFCAFYLYMLVRGRASDNGLTALLMHYVSLFVMEFFFSSNRRFLRRKPFDEILICLKNTAIIAVILAAMIFIVHAVDEVSRMVTLFTVVLYFVLDFFARLLLKKLLLVRAGNQSDRILLCTDLTHAAEFVRAYNENPSTYRRVTAIASADGFSEGGSVQGVPVVSDLRDVFSYARSQIVDEVILFLPGTDEHVIQELIDEFESMGIVVSVILPEVNHAGNYIVRASVICGYAAMTYSRVEQNPNLLMLKRIADLFFGVLGCIATGLLFLILGPIIKLDSKGPVFFKQKRVGRNGRFFRMYKFRSMVVDAEEKKKDLMDQNEISGQMFKIADDPRVTRVGRFLRKTSLDEFPQFLNILKGDMSLIGTRPPTVDEFLRYEDHHKRRLSMKPGLTGLWQVSGRSEITDFEDVVRLDCEYIDNWSLALDLKIFLKTIAVVFQRKGSG